MLANAHRSASAAVTRAAVMGWGVMKTKLPILAAVAVTALPPARAQTADETLAIIRKQFANGISLVQSCRYTLHTSDLLVCRNRAVSRGAGRVTKTLAAGADYGILVIEYETGNVELTEVLAVRDAAQELVDGDIDAFCSLFDVDCSPVKGAMAQMKSVLDLMDKVEAKRKAKP